MCRETGTSWRSTGAPTDVILIVASRDGRAGIIDRTGREVQVLREDDGYRIEGARFSPDGRSVALSALPDGEILGLEPRTTIWDLDRGKVVTTISGIGDPSFAFSPDGARIITVSEPGPAEVWDTKSGERLEELTEQIIDVAFSPDGTRIAATSVDSGVRLYDATSFELQLVLRGHAGGSSWVDFSPDGTMLVSSGRNDIVRVWALEIDDLLEVARRNVTRPLTDEECRQYLHVGSCPTPA